MTTVAGDASSFTARRVNHKTRRRRRPAIALFLGIPTAYIAFFLGGSIIRALPAYAKLTYLIQQETEAVMTGSATPAEAATQYANGVESLVGSQQVESVPGAMTTSQLRPPGLRRAGL